MTKRVAFAASVLMGFVSVASAEEKKPAPTKEEAQAKADAAKVEVCEKGKKFLADRKAKGSCGAESDEAAKITCAKDTWTKVNALMTKCAAGKPADKGAGSGAAAPADAAATPKCRAVDKADATKVLGEAEDKLSTRCARFLTNKMKETACADAANTGKRVEWVTQFDHMIGKNKLKDGKGSFTCPKAKPAKETAKKP
ncbi:MAG: hypothetical protein ACKV2T_43760 [Kofleriaceae bacterium]